MDYKTPIVLNVCELSFAILFRMDSKVEVTLSYPEALKMYRKRHTEIDVRRQIMKQVASEIDNLKSAQSCLSIGTGYGDYDIDFIKLCLPNLKRLVVVEMNHDCVEDLKVNLKTNFGEKLEIVIHEMSVESFTKNAEALETFKGTKVDVVMFFHVFYTSSYDDIRDFFKICLNSCLHPNSGLIVFAQAVNDNVLMRISRQLETFTAPYVCCEQIKDEIRRLGMAIVKEIPYSVPVDLRVYDHDIYYLLNDINKLDITHDTMKKAIKKVAPTGWDTYDVELCVVSKMP